MSVRQGSYDIGAQKLEWAEWGDSDARDAFVLLHEGLGCAGLWLSFPEALAVATGRRVVAYSRAGYGRSSPISLPRPLDYMTREAQDVLPGVLDAIGAERVILLGHSDGASIAAIHAGTVDDSRVRGAVLIAPHFFTEPTGLAAISRAKYAYEHGALREKLARWHTHVDCAFFGWNLAWLDPEFAGWNIEDVLLTVRAPVCVVQGDADPYGTLAQVRAAERGVPARVSTHVLPGIGHSPHREAEADLVKIVQAFEAKLT